MKTIAIVLACATSVLYFAGCSTADANPTSRATTATYGDVGHEIKIVIDEKAHGNTVNITLPIDLGDGAFASADSKGSTETTSPTLTPTTDIKPDIDVNYAQGGSASSSGAGSSSGSAVGILESLTSKGFDAIRSYLNSGSTSSQTIQVTKSDGTVVTAECKDGSCYVDGVKVTKEDCANCSPQ